MMDSAGLAEKLLVRWLPMDATSGREAAMARAAAEALRGLGLEVREQEVAPRRPNLLATRGRPRLLFATHLDTVPPHLDHRVDARAFHGRGACDAKGVLAAMVEAAASLDRPDVGFLLLVGEEVDHAGALASAALAPPPEPRPEFVVLGEPTGNRLVVAQKGFLGVRLEAEGRAAHSGYPHLGVSAVHRLLDALGRVRAGPWPEDPELGATLVNVGLIEGGVAHNVLAPSARATLAVRTVQPEKEVQDRLAALAGEDARVVRRTGNDPFRFHVPEGFPTTVAAFNTDGPYLGAWGARICLAGPGRIEDAHRPDERMDRASLAEGVSLYRRLAEALLA